MGIWECFHLQGLQGPSKLLNVKNTPGHVPIKTILHGEYIHHP